MKDKNTRLDDTVVRFTKAVIRFRWPVVIGTLLLSFLTVTFIAILELLRESVIEVAQAKPFAPLHIRAASSVRLVDDGSEQTETDVN